MVHNSSFHYLRVMIYIRLIFSCVTVAFVEGTTNPFPKSINASVTNSISNSGELLPSDSNNNNSNVHQVADTINSIPFLHDLMALKNVYDVTYLNVPLSHPSEMLTTTTHKSICEYTGKLWFMPKKGIQFREIVQVKQSSSDSSLAFVECDTDYKVKDTWMNCSKLKCTMKYHNDHRDKNTLGVLCQSDILVPIPLPRLAKKALNKKIESTFMTAIRTFLKKSASIDVSKLPST